jgi:hypothetical protein
VLVLVGYCRVFYLFSGVCPRTVLGPVLFTLFINDLCRVVRSSQYHVYADEFQFYRWSVDNGLLLNGKKAQAMIICREQGRLPSHVPELRLNGDLVVYTNKVRYLGGSFRDQANDILWHYADVTPVLTRKRLVQMLLRFYLFQRVGGS